MKMPRGKVLAMYENQFRDPSIEQDVATKEINAPPSSPLKELPDVYPLSSVCESFQVEHL